LFKIKTRDPLNYRLAVEKHDLADLFEKTGLERLPIDDAEVLLQRGINLGMPYEALIDKLIETTPWRQEEIMVYGKRNLQPRLSAWYGTVEYAYSGISLKPWPWTETLLKLKQRLEAVIGHQFNSVLLNYYRDQNDSMGMHSDDEAELGKQPVIASLSLGEERSFLLRHKYRKDIKTIKLPLSSGSLLIMRGDTQSYWKHGIAKESKPCGPRVNLTFRSLREG
jgi:alkylated DNA repair dioxygenase AlkB